MFSVKSQQLKIKIISISDRPDLYTTTFKRMHDYCIRHNYSFDSHLTTLASERHISWSKVQALRDASVLHDMDYLVWMDDDIYITDIYRPLESFIISHQFTTSSAPIMISAEPNTEPICNCGIMICKVGPELELFLERVWKDASIEQWWSGNWEQDVIVDILKKEPHHAMVVQHRIIQSFVRNWGITEDKHWRIGDFAAHITGMPLETRIFYLKNIMGTLEITSTKDYNRLNVMLKQICPMGPSAVLLTCAPDCVSEYNDIFISSGAGICHHLPTTYDKIRISDDVIVSLLLIKLSDEIKGLILYNMLKDALHHVRIGGWLIWYAVEDEYLELVKNRICEDYELIYECKTITGWNAMRRKLNRFDKLPIKISAN